MKLRTLTLALTLAGLLAACGDGGSGDGVGPAPPQGPLTLSATHLSVTSIGDTATVSATSADGQTSSRPSLSLLGESRWIGDMAVLDAGALQAGRIVAAAPGTATLSVSAFGLTPVELRVDVTPSGPVVLAVDAPRSIGPTDTIRLVGYQMDRITPTAPGVGLTTLAQDSARVQLQIGAAPNVCAGVGRFTLDLGSAAHPVSLTLTRKRPGAVDLGVGETTDIASGPDLCVKFAPQAVEEAQYALIFFDARDVVHAQEVSDDVGTQPVRDLDIRVASHPTPASAATSVAPAAALASTTPSPDVRDVRLSPSYVYPHQHQGPWSVGEQFTITESDGNDYTVVVDTIYDDYLVIAVDPAYESAFREHEAIWNSVGPWLAQHYVPWAVQTLGLSQKPESSVGAGQMLVLLSNTGLSVPGQTGGVLGASYIEFSPTQHDTWGYLFYDLAHEIGHTLQWQYGYDTWNTTTPGAWWAFEGTADLLAHEASRLRMGISIDAEVSLITSPDDSLYAYRFHGGINGDIAHGYGPAGAMLAHYIRVLDEAGLDHDTSVAQVVLGALEGWYGAWSEQPGAAPYHGTGLVGRMRASGLAGWDAPSAVLDYVQAWAGDGLVGNTLSEWQDYPIFMERARLNLAQADSTALTPFHDGVLYQSSAGFVNLADSVGGSLAVHVNQDHVLWRLLRVR